MAMSDVNEKAPAIKGSCACGRVKYAGTVSPSRLSNCYCKTCQKIAGPFLSAFMVPSSSIQWTNDTPPDIWKSTDTAERGHCNICGSAISMQFFCSQDSLFLATSSLDWTLYPLPSLGDHIFVDEKPSWYTLPDDGVPRFKGMDTDLASRLREWKDKMAKSR